ncbi:MAG: dephospho-CoA kinase [Alphaproteobacteria bacterium]
MIVVGLTGSIAMGKSTIGAMMRGMNIPVHEADHEVHALLKPDGGAYQAVVAAFPYFEYPNIYDRKTKLLKRKELGNLVFYDGAHRQTLESILHPLVRQAQDVFIRSFGLKGADMVCLDIPLLFETGAEKRVDYTVVVSAPYHLQRARVLERPGMSEKKFHAILERQMPDKEKCLHADYVIKTGLGRAYAMKELKSVIEKIHEDHKNCLNSKG